MNRRAENRTPSFPRGALLVAFSMVAMSLATAGYHRWVSPRAPAVLPASEVTVARALRFEDTAAGQVMVVDAVTDSPIDYLDPGTNGFLRATLRGLARARMAVSKGAETPFVIQRHANGQVLLVDPVTERFIDLRAFGPTNSAVFTRYLEPDVPPGSGG